jgi:hypothetical protein
MHEVDELAHEARPGTGAGGVQQSAEDLLAPRLADRDRQRDECARGQVLPVEVAPLRRDTCNDVNAVIVDDAADVLGCVPQRQR